MACTPCYEHSSPRTHPTPSLGPLCVCVTAWSLKLLFAIGTDSFKPFGMRRKPYMLAGWALILVLLLAIGVVGNFKYQL